MATPAELVGHCVAYSRVVGVGRLEPGARIAEIEMDGVGGGELVVDAVEEVLLVALVVDGVELGRIEEAAGVHHVGGDEVAGLLRAVRRD